jgi:hypothetical protein
MGKRSNERKGRAESGSRADIVKIGNAINRMAQQAGPGGGLLPHEA